MSEREGPALAAVRAAGSVLSSSVRDAESASGSRQSKVSVASEARAGGSAGLPEPLGWSLARAVKWRRARRPVDARACDTACLSTLIRRSKARWRAQLCVVRPSRPPCFVDFTEGSKSTPPALGD